MEWDTFPSYVKEALESLHESVDTTGIEAGASFDAELLKASSDQQACSILQMQIEKDVTDYNLAMEKYREGEVAFRGQRKEREAAVFAHNAAIMTEVFKQMTRWVRGPEDKGLSDSPSKRKPTNRAQWFPTMVRSLMDHAARARNCGSKDVLVVNEVDMSIAGHLSTKQNVSLPVVSCKPFRPLRYFGMI